MLRELGQAGSALTDFVEPAAKSSFALAFEVPQSSQRLRFVTKHGWFPRAIIIGDEESLMHRPTVVKFAVAPAR